MKTVRKILERYYILIVLILVGLFFSVAATNFFTLRNLTNIFVQNSYLIIATIGIAMIMISSGADLSVSYQIGLVSIVAGKTLTQMGLPSVIGIILGLLTGVLLGFINGFCTVKLKVHPMVTTMATMTIYQGIAFVTSNSETYFNFPETFKAIGQGYIGPIPICSIIMVICVIVGYIMLTKTYFGRYVYSLGGNEEAARLSGINVKLVRVLAFMISGVFVAIAALVVTARTGSASAGIATDAMFTCFTACVLGGISFNGGGGNVLNVVLSVFILGMLANGMQMMGLSIYAQYIAKGVLLIAAIAYDNYQKAAKLKEA